VERKGLDCGPNRRTAVMMKPVCNETDLGDHVSKTEEQGKLTSHRRILGKKYGTTQG